ncbi:hypothetical protein D3C86_1471950 [compost metagenome]
MLSSDSRAMPRPWSMIWITSVRWRTIDVIEIDAPGGENLEALSSRFWITCTSRVRSTNSGMSSVAAVTPTGWDLAASAGSAASMPSAMISRACIGSRRSSILPAAMRPTSSRSSTSRVRWVICRSIRLRLFFVTAGSCGRSRITVSALRMGASGLRNSCESVARNSFMRRSDCSSSASRLRSLMSRVTLAKPRRFWRSS